jgi:DNA-directed RNA polymerase II subunit RPB1
MCGTLAAQSIGEPATQMTLNAFHYAVKMSPSVFHRPHLKEIINIATNIKTPSLTVYLKPEIVADSALAKNVQQELAYTLRTVTAAVEIWYHPNSISTIIANIKSSHMYSSSHSSLTPCSIRSAVVASRRVLCSKTR